METNQVIIAVLGTMASVIGFFSIRTLKQVDENQAKLSTKLDEGLGEAFERLRSVELDLTGLKAEHKINHLRVS
ncbi:MAG: hypothetical protein HGB02_08550 [Chlorobiaceae bacterium]|nr:hypothetical protein [Chlorobiaceae bacterium]